MSAEFVTDEDAHPWTFQPWTPADGLQALWLGCHPHDGITVEPAPRPGRRPEDKPAGWSYHFGEPVGVAIFATDDPYEGAILNRDDVKALVAWLSAWLESPAASRTVL